MKKKKLINLFLVLGFLLGISDGHIALWHDGQSAPQVFPYRAEYLPIADQRALEQGISISSEEELSKLLEDYLS